MARIIAQGFTTLTKLDETIQIKLSNDISAISCYSDGTPKLGAFTTADTFVEGFRGSGKIPSNELTIGKLMPSKGVEAEAIGNRVFINNLTEVSGYVDIPVSLKGSFLGVYRFNTVKQIDGLEAASVRIVGENVFKYSNTNVVTPEEIHLSAIVQNIKDPTFTWFYKTQSGGFELIPVEKYGALLRDSRSNRLVDSKDRALYTSSGTLRIPSEDVNLWGDRKNLVIRCSVSNQMYDEFTITKIKDGSEAYTVVLTNENHSFAATDEGNVVRDTSIITEVVCYKGIDKIVPTAINMPSSKPNGLNWTVSGTKITITALRGSSLADFGTLPIEVVLDSKVTIKKDFTWSKVKNGRPGAQGESGGQGAQGEPGEPGIGYTVNITGGNRGIVYSAIGDRPEPKTAGTFTVELLKNGKVISPSAISWSSGGNLSGASTSASFSPVLRPTYLDVSTFVKVVVRDGATSLAQVIPVICNKHAGGLDWIEDWNNNKTKVEDQYIVSPKIFAGTGGSRPSGVALGKNVFGTKGTLSNVTGLVGYKEGIPTFSITDKGDLLIGDKNKSYLSFDGKSFEVSADKIKFTSSSSTIKEEMENLDKSFKSTKTALETSIDTISLKADKVERKASQTNGTTRCQETGLKVNYESFTLKKNGELYIHGYDEKENPSDKDGSISLGDNRITIRRGKINPENNFGSYVVYICGYVGETNTYGVYYDKMLEQWQCRGLIGTSYKGVPDITNPNYVCYGVFKIKSTKTFDYAYLLSEPKPLNQAINNIYDIEERLKTAELKVQPDSIKAVVSDSINKAKTDAINEAVRQSNVKISALEVTTGKISGTVSETNRKLDTVSTTVNNIKNTDRLNYFNIDTSVSLLTGRDLAVKEVNGMDKYCKALKITFGSTSGSLRFNNLIETTGVYSVSFYARSSTANHRIAGVDICDYHPSSSTSAEVTREWKKFTYENFNVQTVSSSVYHFMDIALESTKGNIDIEICKVMINKGAIASDWSANPKELEKKVDTQIQTVEKKVASVTTEASNIKASVSHLETKSKQLETGVRCQRVGMKVNYDTFVRPNNGELYIHGYDAYENPVDQNGVLNIGGNILNIQKGMINPDTTFGTSVVYICGYIGETNSYGIYYNTSEKRWWARNLIGPSYSAAADVNNSRYICYGVFQMNSGEAFGAAYLLSSPMPVSQAINNSADIEQRLRKAEIKVEDSSIISTVSDTIKRAKDEAITDSKRHTDNALSTIKSDVTTLQQTSDSITASVNSIKNGIGSANHLLNSDVELVSPERYKQLAFEDFRSLRGKTITVSVEVEGNGTFRRVGVEPAFRFRSGRVVYVGAWINGSFSGRKRISQTATLPDEEIVDMVQDGMYIQDVTSGSITLRRPQLELGSVPTDWKPSSTDFSNEMSELKIESDRITSTVSTVLGTGNMMPNGVLKGQSNPSGWSLSSGLSWSVVNEHTGVTSSVRGREERFVSSDYIDISKESQRVFSLSTEINAERNTYGAQVFLIGSRTKSNAYDWTMQLINYAPGEYGVKQSPGIQVPSDIKYLWVRIDYEGWNGSPDYRYVYINWVNLVKGGAAFNEYGLQHNGLLAKVASLAIKDDSIMTTVGNNIESAKNQAISSANSATDSKLSNYTKSSEFSSFKQTSNQFQFNITRRGAKNYLKGANGAKGMIDGFWTVRKYATNRNPRKDVVHPSWSQWAYPDPTVYTFQLNESSNWALEGGDMGIIQHNVPVQKGQTYTFSCWVASHRHADVYCYIRGRANSEYELIGSYAFAPSTGGTDKNNWTKCTVTFTAERDYCHVELGMRGHSTGHDPYLWFAKPMLNEGALASEFNDSSNEVHSGIVRIDEAGVRCDFEDGSYSQMGRDGFQWYKSGMKHPYHCLMARGSVDRVASNQTVRIWLPEEFRGKNYEISWWTGNVFPEHNTDLLFAVNSELVGQNKSEGWFDIRMSMMVRNPNHDGAPNWRGHANVVWVAIA